MKRWAILLIRMASKIIPIITKIRTKNVVIKINARSINIGIINEKVILVFNENLLFRFRNNRIAIIITM